MGNRGLKKTFVFGVSLLALYGVGRWAFQSSPHTSVSGEGDAKSGVSRTVALFAEAAQDKAPGNDTVERARREDSDFEKLSMRAEAEGWKRVDRTDDPTDEAVVALDIETARSHPDALRTQIHSVSHAKREDLDRLKKIYDQVEDSRLRSVALEGMATSVNPYGQELLVKVLQEGAGNEGTEQAWSLIQIRSPESPTAAFLIKTAVTGSADDHSRAVSILAQYSLAQGADRLDSQLPSKLREEVHSAMKRIETALSGPLHSHGRDPAHVEMTN